MPADAERLLVEFLAERDVACPACGYSLRDLTTPTCPECGEGLRLHIAGEPVRFGLFIATIVPCMFSGIAGLFLLIPIVIEGGGAPFGVFVLDGFGLASGAVGVALIARRGRFIRQTRDSQLTWVVSMWLFHAVAFVILVASIL